MWVHKVPEIMWENKTPEANEQHHENNVSKSKQLKDLKTQWEWNRKPNSYKWKHDLQ